MKSKQEGKIMNQHNSIFQFTTNTEKSFTINIPRFRTVEIKQTENNQAIFPFIEQPNFFSLLEAVFEENGNIIKLLSQDIISADALLEFSALVYYHLQSQSVLINWYKLPHRVLSEETLSKLRTTPFTQLDSKLAFEVAHCYLGQIDVFSVMLDWTQFGTANRITQTMQRTGKYMSEPFAFGGRSFFDLSQNIIKNFLLKSDVTSEAFLQSLNNEYNYTGITIGYLDLMRQYATEHLSQSDKLNATVIDVFDTTFWLAINVSLIQLRRVPATAEIKTLFEKIDFALLIQRWNECKSIIQRYELINRTIFSPKEGYTALNCFHQFK